MAKFKLDAANLKRKSVNRSVRFSPSVYDKLTNLSKDSELSFNKVVNSCVEYALDNMSR